MNILITKNGSNCPLCKKTLDKTDVSIYVDKEGTLKVGHTECIKPLLKK